mmetsp:Transcript_104953/g.266553  ORF Transcript_104953/g.266553 Transcript_104953/m.266553 type:complete len:84 (-) Transcript_104953:875-1126(-)
MDAEEGEGEEATREMPPPVTTCACSWPCTARAGSETSGGDCGRSGPAAEEEAVDAEAGPPEAVVDEEEDAEGAACDSCTGCTC